MTLVLVAANRSETVLVSDRRLTRAGVPQPEQATKLNLLLAIDARLLVAFSGLAEIPGYSRIWTEEWLPRTLWEATARAKTADELVDALTAQATTHLGRLAGRLADGRLWILIAGYRYRGGDPENWCAIVTNDVGGKAAATFTRSEAPSGGEPYLCAIGATNAVQEIHLEEVARFVREGRPARAVAGRALVTVRDAALRGFAGELVGPEVNVVVLPADQGLAVSSDLYCPDTVNGTTHIYCVDARNPGPGPVAVPVSVQQRPMHRAKLDLPPLPRRAERSGPFKEGQLVAMTVPTDLSFERGRFARPGEAEAFMTSGIPNPAPLNTSVDDAVVSTNFVSMVAVAKPPPKCWETTVFGGTWDRKRVYHLTRTEAVAFHGRLVAALRFPDRDGSRRTLEQLGWD